MLHTRVQNAHCISIHIHPKQWQKRQHSEEKNTPSTVPKNAQIHDHTTNVKSPMREGSLSNINSTIFPTKTLNIQKASHSIKPNNIEQNAHNNLRTRPQCIKERLCTIKLATKKKCPMYKQINFERNQ